jgi:CheY-like chemotaxis protein
MQTAQHLVLMVDDDEDDLLLAQDALAEAQLALRFAYVRNGEEILDYLYQRGEFANASHPNLIFLDLNMPKKDGWEALTEIKANPEFRHIPIIVFTTTRSANEIQQVYRLGASSFIVKPGSFEKMVELFKTVYSYWFKVVELAGTSVGG